VRPEDVRLGRRGPVCNGRSPSSTGRRRFDRHLRAGGELVNARIARPRARRAGRGHLPAWNADAVHLFDARTEKRIPVNSHANIIKGGGNNEQHLPERLAALAVAALAALPSLPAWSQENFVLLPGRSGWPPSPGSSTDFCRGVREENPGSR